MRRLAAWIVAALLLAGCGASNAGGSSAIRVVAGEDFWGSLASQLGGSKAHVQSVVTDPNADPARIREQHQRRTRLRRGPPTSSSTAPATTTGANSCSTPIRSAAARSSPWRLSWASTRGTTPFLVQPRLCGAGRRSDHGRVQVDRSRGQRLFHAPAAGVRNLAAAYHQRSNEIKATFAGRKVGSTESIFVYMATYLGLNLISPPEFMQAVAEGNDPACRCGGHVHEPDLTASRSRCWCSTCRPPPQ